MCVHLCTQASMSSKKSPTPNTTLQSVLTTERLRHPNTPLSALSTQQKVLESGSDESDV